MDDLLDLLHFTDDGVAAERVSDGSHHESHWAMRVAPQAVLMPARAPGVSLTG